MKYIIAIVIASSISISTASAEIGKSMPLKDICYLPPTYENYCVTEPVIRPEPLLLSEILLKKRAAELAIILQILLD